MATTALRKRTASVFDQPLTHQQPTKRQRLPQTCEWIQQEQTYKTWKQWDDASSSTLWLHGRSGCGKSYLTQYIIDDLKSTDTKSAVLTHFCNSNSTPSSVMISVLSQLLHHPLAQTDLKEKISETVSQLTPDMHTIPIDPTYRLWDKVISIMEEAPPITLIIDGLDEMSNKYLLPQEFDFPAHLMELTTVMAAILRLLVSSRTEVGFRKVFDKSLELEITQSKISEDMRRFALSEVSLHTNLEVLKDEIVEVIVAKSEGIFQWATVAVKVLAQQTTSTQLRKKLDSLWRTSLYDLYTSYFQHQELEISTEDISIRDSILRVLVFAVRPFTITEISNFLTVELNVFIPNLEEKILEVCGGLVKTSDSILSSTHHSLRDFLQSDHSGVREIANIDSSTASLIMAGTLLQYLSHEKFAGLGESLERNDFQSTHPLAEYATLYWVHHASQSGFNSKLQSQIEAFCNKPNPIEWAQKLLPLYLHRSVLSIPPRPSNTARFFHLFTLKSQIVNCFQGDKKTEFDKSLTNSLRLAYEETVTNARRWSGDESEPVFKALLDLAEVYSWTTDYQKNVISTLKEALGFSSHLNSPAAHALIVSAHQALADEQKRNGQYEQSQQTFTNLLEQARTIFPATDPAIMFASDGLGWVYMRLGKLELSATYLETALKIASEIYGSNSPLTLRSKVTLAEVYGKLGRNEEARFLCRTLEDQLKLYNENGIPIPKDSIAYLNSLAAIYMQEGKFGEAKEMYGVVVKERKGLFGEDSRLTLWAEMQWGMAMEENEEGEEARRVFEGLIGRQERVLGGEHPDVKAVGGKLGRN